MQQARDHLIVSALRRRYVVPMIDLRVLRRLHEEDPLCLHGPELDHVQVADVQLGGKIASHPHVVNPKEPCRFGGLYPTISFNSFQNLTARQIFPGCLKKFFLYFSIFKT